MVAEPILSTKPVRGFLVDITGVLYNSRAGTDGNVIPGSIEAVKRLYKESNVRFLSNKSMNTTEHIVARLTRLGYDIKIEDVILPGPVAAEYIRKKCLRPHLLVYSGIAPYFANMERTDANCVVMGDAEHEFTFEAMNSAFRALMKMQDPLLISLGNGRFYQRADGPTIDVGAFAAALRFSTDCRHVIIGKPSNDYFQSAVDSLGLDKDEVVMIGDDIITDIDGAQQFGLRAVQVRTGKWRPEWEHHPTVKPTLIANNLKEAIESYLGPTV